MIQDIIKEIETLTKKENKMKASETIKQLQKLIKDHGDLEVNVFDPDKLHNGEIVECDYRICINCDKNNKPQYFAFVDRETALGFDE